MTTKATGKSATVKVYHGYGHTNNLVVYGHVLSGKAVVRRRFTRNVFINVIHLIRLFFIKPVAGVRVQLHWNNQQMESITESDGFFKFEWRSAEKTAAGWHPVTVHLLDGPGGIAATGTGKIFVPHITQYAFISDIDDTVLISHSATKLKRLLELFTRGPHNRKAFADVVEHYKLLAVIPEEPSVPNPFFYVSSSEWNMYDDLNDFFNYNELPGGVFLLNEIKRWYQLFQTGKTKHQGKLIRIARILDAFPEQRFVLLGDNSQRDPGIYAAIANKYPGKIKAIYIRNISRKNELPSKQQLESIQNKAIQTCIFNNDKEAILHSRNIGLIR